MQFEYFEQISQKDATALLQRFLEVESSRIHETAKLCAVDGIKMDFTIKSISPFMRWVLKKLTKIRKKPDPAVPAWIRNTETYAKNLFEFDEQSGKLILRAAYYYGESFVRSYDSLRWGTGDLKTALGNMPVVAGFQHELEMAPILVADNLFSRITREPDKIGDIQISVAYWRDVAS